MDSSFACRSVAVHSPQVFLGSGSRRSFWPRRYCRCPISQDDVQHKLEILQRNVWWFSILHWMLFRMMIVTQTPVLHCYIASVVCCDTDCWCSYWKTHVTATELSFCFGVLIIVNWGGVRYGYSVLVVIYLVSKYQICYLLGMQSFAYLLVMVKVDVWLTGFWLKNMLQQSFCMMKCLLDVIHVASVFLIYEEICSWLTKPICNRLT